MPSKAVGGKYFLVGLAVLLYNGSKIYWEVHTMKRTISLLALCLLLLLTACGRKTVATVYDVEHNGVTYTVDKEHGTISDSEHTYQIEVGPSGRDVTVHYPDGSHYWWSYGDTVSHGGWSSDYDEDKYAPGDTLLDIYFPAGPVVRQESSSNWLVALLLMAVGIFNTAAPETAWYLSRGWQFKNAEPSEAALLLTRCSGVVAIVVGVVLVLG